MKYIFLAIVSFSCSTLEKKNSQMASWIGHSTEELKTHPEFSHFKLRIKEDKLILGDGSPILSKAECQSLGGCMGIPKHWCDHTFTINNDKIVKYEQIGPCTYNEKLYPIEEKNR